MVDYCPVSAYVSLYAESVPTFDDVYPHILYWASVNTSPPYYEYKPTDFVYQSGMDLDTGTIPDIVGSSVVAFSMYYYDGAYYDNFEVCYYASCNDTLYRITQNDVSTLVSQGMKNPFSPVDLPVYNQSSIVSWLYSLGDSLINNNALVNLLSLEIGGYSLISLLITSGFTVYALWIVAKWIIP